MPARTHRARSRKTATSTDFPRRCGRACAHRPDRGGGGRAVFHPTPSELVSRRNERQPSWRLQALIGQHRTTKRGQSDHRPAPAVSGSAVDDASRTGPASTLPPESTMTTFLPPGVDPPRQQRGEPDGATGFDHELQLAIGKATAAPTSSSVALTPFAQQLAVDREGELARHHRHQRIADGARRNRMRLAMPDLERQRVIVTARGLGDDHLGLRDTSPSPRWRHRAINPPPDAGATTRYQAWSPSAAMSSAISRPAVPWPAITKDRHREAPASHRAWLAMLPAIAARSSRSRS